MAERTVRNYRMAMAQFAQMRTADVWYALIDERQYVKMAQSVGRKKQAAKVTRKAKSCTSLQALEKLAVEVDGQYRIKSNPPLLVPLRELSEDLPREDIQTLIDQSFEHYRATVHDECKALLSRFHTVDAALKVVGVGSVDTRCGVVLLEGRDRQDPLLLQVKQASSSVLEEFLTPSIYPNHGQRVVEGQRLIQTVSDIYLGWTRSVPDHDYYWRQLRDWKGAVDVENVEGGDLHYLACLCGWTLARAHARTGDPIAMAGYLGKSTAFDTALAEFARHYADQNERDFRAFSAEIDAGRLAVAEG